MNLINLFYWLYLLDIVNSTLMRNPSINYPLLKGLHIKFLFQIERNFYSFLNAYFKQNKQIDFKYIHFLTESRDNWKKKQIISQ